MIRYPRAIENRYRRLLLRRVDAIRRTLLMGVRRDADDLSLDILRTTRRVWLVDLAPSADDLEPIARAVDTHATQQAVRMVERVAGVKVTPRELAAQRGRWVLENQRLIRNAEAELFDKVAAEVAEGRLDLAKRLSVARARAELIAVNEVSTLNARVTEARQRQGGIERYEWSTSGDERVRPEHRALDGTVRSWGDPHPTEGHPGEAIRCRCVAIPVVD